MVSYLSTSIAALVLSIICEVLLVNVSLKGTIIETEARSGLGFYLTAHTMLGLLQFLLTFFGFAVISAHSSIPCVADSDVEDRTDMLLLAIVVISQFVDVISMVCCCYAFSARRVSQPLGPDSDSDSDQEQESDKDPQGFDGVSTASDPAAVRASSVRRRERSYNDHVGVWEARCKSMTKSLQLLSCNVFGGSGHMAEDFTAVARVLTHFFQHDGFLDVVPSDVAAGICLLRLQQRFELPPGVCPADELSQSAVASPVPDHATSYRSLEQTRALGEEGGSLSGVAAAASKKQDPEVAAQGSDQAASRAARMTVQEPAGPSTGLLQRKSQGVSASAAVPVGQAGLKMDTEFRDHLASMSHYKRSRLEGRRVLSGRSGADQVVIEKAFHYSVYALALYSQLIYMYMHPVSGMCRLCGCCDCGGCDCLAAFKPTKGEGGAEGGDRTDGDIESGGDQRRQRAALGTSVGDNRFNVHRTAVSKILGMFGKGDAEIRHLSMVNTTFAKPYGIFVDHVTHAVVISIRGTLSLEDCLTDAMAEPVEMRALGEKWGFAGAGKFAHGGILMAADHLRRDIESTGVLAQLMGRAPPEPASMSSGEAAVDRSDSPTGGISRPLCAQAETYPDYSLVVTGHSLGAASAVLLAMMLRPQYPDLECVTYGTPGAVVDETTAHELKEYVTSVCLGSDIICRSNIHSLAQLREDTLDCIARAKVNKFTITRSMFADRVCLEDVLYPRGQEPASAFKASVVEYKAHIQEQLAANIGEVPLCIPGFVLHLMRTHRVAEGGESGEGGCCCSSGGCKGEGTGLCGTGRRPHRFTPVEAQSPGDFSVVYVSPTMMWDHLPDRYVYELQALHRRFEAVPLASRTADADAPTVSTD